MKQQTKFQIRKTELFSQITKLIEEEGFESLTVRYICQKLNISTGTFYHYFPQKGDLAWALLTDIDDFFLTHVSEQFTENELDNLLIFGKEYGRYVTEKGVETCRYISIAPLNNASLNHLDETRGITQVLKGIFERGLQKQQFKFSGSAQDLTRITIALLRGFSSDWAKRNGGYDINIEILQFMYIYLEGLQK